MLEPEGIVELLCEFFTLKINKIDRYGIIWTSITAIHVIVLGKKKKKLRLVNKQKKRITSFILKNTMAQFKALS